MEVMAGQPKLLEIVGRAHPGGCNPHLLDSGQQQGDQNTNDGNYHQKFDQGEARTVFAIHGPYLFPAVFCLLDVKLGLL